MVSKVVVSPRSTSSWGSGLWTSPRFGGHLLTEFVSVGRDVCYAKMPPYSLEFRREAVRLLRSSDRSVLRLARELGVSPQSLRNWSVQLEVDAGKAEGLILPEREELRRLRRENRVLA